MKKNKLHIFFPLLLSVVMIIGMAIGYSLKQERLGTAFFKNENSSPADEILHLIQQHYVDQVNLAAVEDSGINKMLSYLDPHSVYIPASELQSMNEDLQGSFKGLGIEYQRYRDTANVVSVVENGPAAKAGFRIGDRLLRVDNTTSLVGKNISLDSIQQILRCTQSNTVKLDIWRNGHPQTITVKKGMIPLPALDASYMVAPQTGYIKLNKFSETSYKEFMFALENLQKQGLKKLILDLRGNGGGLLDQAVNMADEFLSDNKLVVYTQGSKEKRQDFICKRDGLFENGKLEVLVDEHSASASEVLTGALQDWDRAIVIGRRTFGKGLVQQQYQLSNGAALRLTVDRYYSPLGRNIQKPYTNDVNDYYEELNVRYKNGELQKSDTSRNHGKAFKTPKGHIVYGGGGITPDVFVGFDTALQPNPVIVFYLKGLMNSFAYQYFLQQQPVWEQYKNIGDFMVRYNPGTVEWSQMENYAKQNNIPLNKISPAAKEGLLHRLKAYLARFLWQKQGYWQVANQYDPVIAAALLEMSKP